MTKAQARTGIHTTEFWATIIFHAASLALVILGQIDATWAAGAMAIAQGTYNISRAMVKKAPASLG
jgi:hypothetical protein